MKDKNKRIVFADKFANAVDLPNGHGGFTHYVKIGELLLEVDSKKGNPQSICDYINEECEKFKLK